ncbi:hypothetical protein GGR56DRAFT_651907 [Xylariaceae sp. FL0804]|nr:hypothetical protein GGR56DRAFT_651907 [Xylariaceae sp. FL0804]
MHTHTHTQNTPAEQNVQLWKTARSSLLPRSPGGGTTTTTRRAALTKPEGQALLHAVEELYFFGRFAEGARFVGDVLGGDDDDGDGGNGNGSGNGDGGAGDEDEDDEKKEKGKGKGKRRGKGKGKAKRSGTGTNGLDRDTRDTLRYYGRRCAERASERAADEQ